MKMRIVTDKETGHRRMVLEDGELRCQLCEDTVVKEDYTSQCSVCGAYVCSKCSATKDDETLVCVDCLEYLCSLPEELKKIKAGIEVIQGIAKGIFVGAFTTHYEIGQIRGTCKVMLHQLEGLKK